MKDKTGIAVGIIIAVAVLVTMFFYLSGAGDIGLGETGIVLVFFLVVVFAIYVIWDRIKSMQKGLPVKDEMERKISWRSGYYGFIAAIWGAVFGPVVIDILFGYELEGSRVTALVVIVASLTFVFSYLYFRKRGIRE